MRSELAMTGSQPQRDGTPQTIAGRVLSILDAFGPQSQTLTLSDISRRTGLPLSTTFRIVTELSNWGALERDRERSYAIGQRLVERANLVHVRRQVS